MFGLLRKKHSEIMTYNEKDDDGDDNRNKGRSDDGNAASGSGSDGLIFDLTTTPLSCGGVSGNEGDVTMSVVHHISTLLKMRHSIM